jgi:hypothetical protein
LRQVGWAESLAYFAYSLTLYYFNNIVFLTLIAVMLLKSRLGATHALATERTRPDHA